MARTKKKETADDPVVESTRAKPWLDRQLPERGPILFWRDGPDESRDGIVCIAAFCESPDCPCHDAFVDVLSTDDHLVSAEMPRSGQIRMPCMADGVSELRRTRRAAVIVDLDTGAMTPEDARPNRVILDWLKEAIDKDVIDLLRRRWRVARPEVALTPAPDDPLIAVPSGRRVARPGNAAQQAKPAVRDVYEMKVTLIGVDPPIWRRFRVPADIPLADLHDVLQIVMGWTNSHLHEYRVGDDLVFGPPDPVRGSPAGDEFRTPLRQVAGPGDTMHYRYDFGDCWDHEATVEKVLPGEAGDEIPTCVEGERACPPEDCGGVPGYRRLLDILFDPAHGDHARMRGWVGRSFGPERFDPAEVNLMLRRRARRRRRPPPRALR